MNECHECFPKIWLNNNFLDQSIVSFVHINSRCIVYFFILLNEVFLIQKSTFSVCSEVYICCKYRREKFRICYCVNKSSAIRQKGESRNGCYKKTKHAKFSEKRTFLTPGYARDISSAIKHCWQNIFCIFPTGKWFFCVVILIFIMKYLHWAVWFFCIFGDVEPAGFLVSDQTIFIHQV